MVITNNNNISYNRNFVELPLVHQAEGTSGDRVISVGLLHNPGTRSHEVSIDPTHVPQIHYDAPRLSPRYEYCQAASDNYRNELRGIYVTAPFVLGGIVLGVATFELTAAIPLADGVFAGLFGRTIGVTLVCMLIVWGGHAVYEIYQARQTSNSNCSGILQ